MSSCGPIIDDRSRFRSRPISPDAADNAENDTAYRPTGRRSKPWNYGPKRGASSRGRQHPQFLRLPRPLPTQRRPALNAEED